MMMFLQHLYVYYDDVVMVPKPCVDDVDDVVVVVVSTPCVANVDMVVVHAPYVDVVEFTTHCVDDDEVV